MHVTGPLILLLFILGALGAAAYYSRRSSIRLDERCWDDLLSAFAPVNLKGVQCIARDFMNPERNHSAMEPEVMWEILGGEVGLRNLERNAALLLSVAAHSAQWNDEDLAVITERMRRDALRLRSALRHIRFGMYSQLLTGRHWISVPFQLQEAASAYYLMRQRLLALFEASNSALLPQLCQSL